MAARKFPVSADLNVPNIIRAAEYLALYFEANTEHPSTHAIATQPSRDSASARVFDPNSIGFGNARSDSHVLIC